MNSNFAFWKMAYEYENKWCDINALVFVTITETNPYGQITKEEYQQITGFVYPNITAEDHEG